MTYSTKLTVRLANALRERVRACQCRGSGELRGGNRSGPCDDGGCIRARKALAAYDAARSRNQSEGT